MAINLSEAPDESKLRLSSAVTSVVESQVVRMADRPGWDQDQTRQIVDSAVKDILGRCLHPDVNQAYVVVERSPAPSGKLVISQVYATREGRPNLIDSFEEAIAQGDRCVRFDLGPAVVQIIRDNAR